ncbi:hypothetical protein JQ632_32455 [Bradyrhizobium liaoningense]|nr:hypothetical protein [Bradyrhizobium liaoningense]
MRPPGAAFWSPAPVNGKAAGPNGATVALAPGAGFAALGSVTSFLRPRGKKDRKLRRGKLAAD